MLFFENRFKINIARFKKILSDNQGNNSIMMKLLKKSVIKFGILKKTPYLCTRKFPKEVP